jgi:hypothetical protein
MNTLIFLKKKKLYKKKTMQTLLCEAVRINSLSVYLNRKEKNGGCIM